MFSSFLVFSRCDCFYSGAVPSTRLISRSYSRFTSSVGFRFRKKIARSSCSSSFLVSQSAMESRFLNPYDKEYMKMAMLKHEETFRDQVNELHRLYRIQKMLMKEIAKNRHRPWKCLDLENRAVEFIFSEPAGGKCRVLEVEDDHENDLELTLGPKSYNQKKIKAAEQTVASDLGPSFSSSKRTRNSTREELWSQKKWAGLEMSNLSNQERLDNPHWHFKVLSLNKA